MTLSIFSPTVDYLHIVCEVYRYFPYLLGHLYCVLRTFGNILNRSPSSDVYIGNISYQSAACLFIVLMMSFEDWTALFNFEEVQLIDFVPC